MTAAIQQNTNENSLEFARKLVLDHGWNSTSFQIINPGISHWFSDENNAVVGFISAAKIRVVAGAPVCEKSLLAEIATEFEKDSAQNKKKVCYFCAEARLESIYDNSKNHSKILLGAQSVWNPKNWAEIVSKHKSLRAQINRARNKNVKVSEWNIEKAQNNPLLRECLEKWLSAKGLPPLHFLVDPNTLTRLENRRVFVAEIEKQVVGFILISPVSMRNGWLFEQFPHVPNSPNGTVELMIDFVMRVLASERFEYATLGLSPLSVQGNIKPFENPFWLRILLTWLRKHGQRFYNFDGLDAFKAKLQPERWEPIFAISNEQKISPQTLYAIASVFSGNQPFRLLFGGLWRALKTEIKWLKEKS